MVGPVDSSFNFNIGGRDEPRLLTIDEALNIMRNGPEDAKRQAADSLVLRLQNEYLPSNLSVDELKGLKEFIGRYVNPMMRRDVCDKAMAKIELAIAIKAKEQSSMEASGKLGSGEDKPIEDLPQQEKSTQTSSEKKPRNISREFRHMKGIR